MRTSFLPFALPDTNEDEVTAVAEVIRSGWLTTGARTREFEAAFARTVGAKHAIAVTRALRRAPRARGRGRQGRRQGADDAIHVRGDRRVSYASVHTRYSSTFAPMI